MVAFVVAVAIHLYQPLGKDSILALTPESTVIVAPVSKLKEAYFQAPKAVKGKTIAKIFLSPFFFSFLYFFPFSPFAYSFFKQ